MDSHENGAVCDEISEWIETWTHQRAAGVSGEVLGGAFALVCPVPHLEALLTLLRPIPNRPAHVDA